MSTGSLFSGIGGLELGLEAAGFGPVIWQVEIDHFCRYILAKHWPHADRSIEDVRRAGAATLARPTLICGGFPCQDVSSAGKGAGLDGARSGLWKEYRRVLSELRPDFAVVENVASGKGRWLCAVRRDLHELGYDTTALAISAEDIGAPHRRSRIFVVAALANGNGNGQRQPGGPVLDQRRRLGHGRTRAMAHADERGLWSWVGDVRSGQPDADRSGEAVAHTDGVRVRVIEQRQPKRRARKLRDEGHAEPCDRSATVGDANRTGRHARGVEGREPAEARPTPDRASGDCVGHADSIDGTQGHAFEDCREATGQARRADRGLAESRMGRDADGLSARLDGHIWPAGRGAYQHPQEPPRTIPSRTLKFRALRIKGLGNAVSPQCALGAGRYLRSVIA